MRKFRGIKKSIKRINIKPKQLKLTYNASN